MHTKSTLVCGLSAGTLMLAGCGDNSTPTSGASAVKVNVHSSRYPAGAVRAQL